MHILYLIIFIIVYKKIIFVFRFQIDRFNKFCSRDKSIHYKIMSIVGEMPENQEHKTNLCWRVPVFQH